MMKTKILVSGAIAAASLLVSQAGIAATTYYLNNSNVYADGPTYATVTLTDLGSGVVQFSVAIAPNLAALGWALDEFAFNTDVAVTFAGLTDVDPDTAGDQTWTSLGGSPAQNQAMDGYGKYNYSVGGSGQAIRSNPVVFTVSSVGVANLIFGSTQDKCGPAQASDCYFAVHIAGLAGTAAATSATHYAAGGPDDENSLVPIPAAAWLLGSGLLGLFGIGRRRRAAS